MDLRSSVRQISHSIRTELKMVSRPTAAATQVSAATVLARSVAGCRVLESESRTQAVRHRKAQPRLQEQTLLPPGIRTFLDDLLLLGCAASTQTRAKRGDGKNAAGESSQYECRVLRRVLTAALSTSRESENQRYRKRDGQDGFRQDGFVHRRSLFCPRPWSGASSHSFGGGLRCITALRSGRASLLP